MATWPGRSRGNKNTVLARLAATLFGPDASARWNLPCLRRGGTRPEEQAGAMSRRSCVRGLRRFGVGQHTAMISDIFKDGELEPSRAPG